MAAFARHGCELSGINHGLMTAGRDRNIGKIAIFGLKIAVTAACFWYVSRQVNFADFARVAKTLDLRWVAVATAIIMIQVPLAGLRWCLILEALGPQRIARAPVIAVTAIGVFFGQVLPNIVGDSVRIWLLSRLGCHWRQGLTGVLIDRGVAVAVMFALGFVILLLPSALTALGGYRDVTLEILGTALGVGTFGLLISPRAAPVMVGWPMLHRLAQFGLAAHRVLIGSSAGAPIVGLAVAMHVLTILALWSLGPALGFSLPLLDAAVLFTAIIVVSLLPIAVGGWGVRELAVTTLLGSDGAPIEQALFFSICFGLVLVIGSLPGAIVWSVYRTGATAAAGIPEN